MHFVRFIKHCHLLKDEGHTLFSVQFLANQFAILALLVVICKVQSKLIYNQEILLNNQI
jgi:hypothetical protein